MSKSIQRNVITPRTLPDLVRHRAGERPEAAVYTFLADGEEDEQRLTYAALDQRARAVAAGLQSLGAGGE
ncbi:AMP-dependent synthetase, partial [bacterium]